MPRKKETPATAGSRKSTRIAKAKPAAVTKAAKPAQAPAKFTAAKRKVSASDSEPSAKKKKGESRNIAVPKKPVAKKAVAPPARNNKKTAATGRGHSSKAKGAKKAVPKPVASRKRKAEDEEEDDVGPASKKSKKDRKIAPLKKVAAAPRKVAAPKSAKEFTTAPTQVLDVYVFGENTAGEIGLGAWSFKDTKNVRDVKRPRINERLGANDVGVVQIALGGFHGAALTRENKILTWGINDEGALGRETNKDGAEDNDSGFSASEAEPREVDMKYFAVGVKFTQLVCSDSTTFVLTSTGKVYGWGQFAGPEGPFGFRRQGPLKQTTPILIPELEKIVALAAGNNHVLALDVKGKVFAWGAGQQYQLARDVSDGFLDSCKKLGLHPTRVLGLKKIVRIGCGNHHSFAVDEAGVPYSWGVNSFAQCGIQPVVDGGDPPLEVKTPTAVPGLEAHRIEQIVGGSHSTIALASDGKVLVWGAVEGCQSGLDLATLPAGVVYSDEDGRPRYLTRPTVVSGLDASHVASGTDTCGVITKDGKAYTWGFNANYQAAQGGDEDDIELPELVDNSAVRGKKLSFVGLNGQFGIIGGIPGEMLSEERAPEENVVQQVAEQIVPEAGGPVNPEEDVVMQESVVAEAPPEEEVVEETVVAQAVVEQSIVEETGRGMSRRTGWRNR